MSVVFIEFYSASAVHYFLLKCIKEKTIFHKMCILGFYSEVFFDS